MIHNAFAVGETKNFLNGELVLNLIAPIYIYFLCLHTKITKDLTQGSRDLNNSRNAKSQITFFNFISIDGGPF